ncbi:MAG: electron transfer flavoprotein subunit beta/FixA family protein [Acidimicrobiales bacterium]|nr:electron transfer flavoprotein subunit beta/FixA family protein [Acidimicrobiales bacterium]
MRILCCVKRVPAPGAKINITADGQDVDTAHLGFAMSPHEECAVEEAVQMAERFDGEATVLTLGPPEAEEQLRYAASLGIHNAVLLSTDGSPWDPQRTAAAIASAIGSLETEGGPFDLILFGNESADSGGYQVGIRVAHALGRPIVNAIKGIDPDLDAGTTTAKREIDGGFELYSLPMPAVLGVKEGLNLPRYPTMKGRLASKKIGVKVLEASADEGGQSRVRLKQPPAVESNTVKLGDGPEAAPAVVDLFEELGLM